MGGAPAERFLDRPDTIGPVKAFPGRAAYLAGGLLAVVLAAALQLGSLLGHHRGDPKDMLRLPSARSSGASGFDGQYFYDLARDPLVGPETVQALDSPHLRARRIGLPLTARLLGAGPIGIPAGLLLAETLAVVLLVAAAQSGARAGGLSPFLVLALPFVLPFALSLELVTAELSAAAAILLAAVAARKGRFGPTVFALALACLFKEVAALAVPAFAGAAWIGGQRKRAVTLLAALIPFGLWEVYLSVHLPRSPDREGLWKNLALPGTGWWRAAAHDLAALLPGQDPGKSLGLLAALLWYAMGAAGAFALARRGATPGRLLALLGAALVLTLSFGGSAQAYDEVFNFGRQLFLLPLGAAVVLFQEPVSPGEARAVRLWLLLGGVLGAGWLGQEILSS
jgi:hypothetical protein